ncbi:MAG: MFS transporter [Bacteroidota bacterium]
MPLPSPPDSAPSTRRGLAALGVAHTLSALADGIYFVALPWLTLEWTGSSAALGGVLALAALPRTLFMVVGGAWADRFAPRWLLAGSSLASATVTALLAAAAMGWFGTPDAWVLYVAAAALGFVDAVAYPAASALVPRLVAPERLHRFNALLGALLQGAIFAGPAAAAGLLAWGGSAPTLAASAAISVLAMGAALAIPRVSLSGSETGSEAEASDDHSAGTFDAIREGWVFVRRRPALLALIVLMGALNLALAGPIIVGGAILAEARFGGPEVFGLIVAAWGAGGLGGSVLASLGTPRHVVGWMLAACALLALGMAAWALPLALGAVLAVTAGLGLVDSWLEIHANTWIQRQTPLALQGRVMGLAMLVLVGLEPLSHVIAGGLVGWSLEGTFLLGATLTALATGVAAWVMRRAQRT